MRRAAIYARQSIEKKDSISIESQVAFCRQILPEDAKEPEVFTDCGYSGKNMERPGFQRMMEAIRQNRISAVYCYKLDRISRSILDFNLMWRELEACNCHFVSYTEKMLDTTTPSGEAQVQMAMLFAQLERQTTALRVKDNYYSRIQKDGRWAGGPAPFGFRIGRTKERIPTLQIVESEMRIVKYCFAIYAAQAELSLGDLCERLRQAGKKSRRTNGTWDTVLLSRMLRSPLYAAADQRMYLHFQVKGCHILNEKEVWDGSTSCQIVGKQAVQGKAGKRRYASLEMQSVYLTNFPGQIDSRTFLRVQKKLEKNQLYKKAAKTGALKELTGLLKCGACGYGIKAYGKKADGTPRLGCYGRYGLKLCGNRYGQVELETLQAQVGEVVQKELDRLSSYIIEEKEKEQLLEKQKKRLHQQEQTFLELAALGGKSTELIHEKLEELKRELEKTELFESILPTTEKLLLLLPVSYAKLPLPQKKQICRELIEKIEISTDGDLKIFWKI